MKHFIVMHLVILLQASHGCGMTQGMFSQAVNSLFLQLLIVVKLAIITALHQMALVTIPPEHVVWMCSVSDIFISITFNKSVVCRFIMTEKITSLFLALSRPIYQFLVCIPMQIKVYCQAFTMFSLM